MRDFIITVVVFVMCVLAITYGCGWMKIANPIGIFTNPAFHSMYPQGWRSVKPPKIEYDIYYHLIDEYESIQQSPSFEFLEWCGYVIG